MSPILALTSHSGDATPVLPVSFRVPFGGVMSAFHTLSVLEPGCYSEVWGRFFQLAKVLQPRGTYNLVGQYSWIPILARGIMQLPWAMRKAISYWLMLVGRPKVCKEETNMEEVLGSVF